MGRFTERDEYGNADIIGVSSLDLQFNLALEEFNKVTNALNKLADYEELEEQKKLMKLPCAVGDTVYRINKGKKEPIIPMRVIGIAIRNENELVIQTKDIADDNHNLYSKNSIGKTVFLTKEAAEAALDMKGYGH
ncbi:MAG: hypothetical protein HFH43_08810 [Lachnospiraceae bacterium]|nr:hypothetical protein [Lachnospiraceae bacterium]MCI8883120.1 hypothetical protein [Lachnospiraceae bacterium]